VITNVGNSNAGQYYLVATNWGGAITTLMATLTVIYPPVISINATIPSVNEASFGFAQFTFNRNGDTNSEVTAYFTVSGNATPNTDYAPIPSSITFPAGTTTATLNVFPINDSIREGDENIVITLVPTTEYDIRPPESAKVIIYDDDNAPPTVSITSPADNSIYPFTPTNIPIAATASDPDGSVSKIEFFADTNKIGEAISQPFSIVWTNANYGTNIIRAIAIDDLGATAQSSAVKLIVNYPPSVAITLPLNGATYAAGFPVTVEIHANDADGIVTNIIFLLNKNNLTNLLAPPFTFTLNNLPIGTNELMAIAFDNYGIGTTSPPVVVIITSPGFFDDFEPNIDTTQWSSFGGELGKTVIATNYGGSVSGVNSLWFGGDSQRYAATRAINTLQGGQVVFYLRISNGSSEPWEMADLPDEGVVLEYSVNNGNSWSELARYDSYGAPYTINWQMQTVMIPEGAQRTNTMFRWRQLSHSGSCCDHWAIDDVRVLVGPTPPFIIRNPENATAIVGGTTVFSVSAGGSSPLYYQWYFNENPIPSMTNSTLTLTDISTNNSGNYFVVVINTLGSATSAIARLTVVEATIDTFRIVSLTTNRHYAIEHSSVTGDDRGGIAISSTQLFLTGDSSTARFKADDLSGGTSLNRVYDSLCSDLRTERVYLLANENTPITSSGGTATTLLELDSTTGITNGNRIALSSQIPLNNYGTVGIFSGFGRIAIYNGTRLYDILLPSGNVIDRGTMSMPTHTYSENWAIWGVAEYYGGSLYIVYVQNSSTIVRTRVPDGLTSTVATFNNLSDMASFTVSLRRNRWYFHHEGTSQFRSGDETVGYADATFEYNVGTNIPPSIAIEPRSFQVIQGTNVTFEVIAFGTLPLYYQWQFNGTNISGANLSTFTVENVQPQHIGEYRVVVTNAFGSVTSAVATLTIGTPITILKQPDSLTVNAGTNVSFEVIVNGSEPISYQWIVTPASEPSFSYEIPGATNSILMLTNVSYYHSGSYSVAIANPVSSVTSKVATLTVLSPPFWVVAPSSRQYVTGMVATLEARADGSSPLFYQWRKDGVSIPNGTNAALIFQNVQSNHVGAYDLVVSNIYGVITSSVAYINLPQFDENTFVITSLKTIGTRTINIYPDVGYSYFDGMAAGSARLFVNGYSSAASYSLQDLADPIVFGRNLHCLASDLKSQKVYLFANNTNLLNYYGGIADSLIQLDEQTGALTTNIIKLSTNLNISGAIFSGYGRIVVISSIYLPSVYDIHLPSGKVTELGRINQYLEFNYDNSWYIGYGIAEFLGTNIYLVYVRDTTSIVRTRVPDGDTTVVASFVNLGYMGNITVSIPRNRWYFRFYGTSQFGGTSSGETAGYAAATFAYLTASTEPPTIIEQPQSQVVAVGGNVTFKVIASGAAPLSYQWHRNNQPLPNQTNSTLFIANVRQNVSGDYFVTVSNQSGATTSSVATLSVLYPVIGYVTNLFMPMTNIWKYNQTAAYTTTNNWVSPLFDDSSWQSGAALLYVETNPNVEPKNTPLTLGRITYYFRTTVVLPTNPPGSLILAQTMIDDGAIIYVNGREIQRVRYTSLPSYSYYASAQPPGGDAVLESFTWQGTNFVQGTNYIAVEVHQDSNTSSDIVWGMALYLLNPIRAVPPQILVQPVSQNANVGDTVVFTVEAIGTPPLYFQWLFNGANIYGARSPTLTLTNVSQLSAGYYSLKVQNNYDIDYSQAARLFINAPPLIGEFSKNGAFFEFNIYANPDGVYSIETSTNLSQWELFKTITNSAGNVRFSDNSITNNNSKYYRIKVVR
ncbi:MAG: immunoglobulin domain-containing protein, partial [Verrucomicrobiia bacterium]